MGSRTTGGEAVSAAVKPVVMIGNIVRCKFPAVHWWDILPVYTFAQVDYVIPRLCKFPAFCQVAIGIVLLPEFPIKRLRFI